MRLLKRVLGRSGCRAAGRSGGTRGHLASCPSCRARQEQERGYLERLRGAAIPPASDDLTARLLARTGQLAAGLPDLDPSTLLPAPQGRSRSRLRGVGLTAGAAAAAMTLMTGAAYLVGGPAAPPADRAGAGAFFRHSAARSAAAGDPGTGPASAGMAWTLTGMPELVPAGTLSAEQLAILRSQGWACPELRSLGFHLVWVRGGVLAGENVLELRLTDGQHFATVLEHHGAPVPVPGAAAGHGPAAPLNVLTGHPATADGFTAAGGSGIPGTHGPGSGLFWLKAAVPFQAIYQASGTTFTFVTDLPAERAGSAVAALMQPDAGIPAGPPGQAGVPERIQRGLGRILQFLAP